MCHCEMLGFGSTPMPIFQGKAALLPSPLYLANLIPFWMSNRIMHSHRRRIFFFFFFINIKRFICHFLTKLKRNQNLIFWRSSIVGVCVCCCSCLAVCGSPLPAIFLNSLFQNPALAHSSPLPSPHGISCSQTPSSRENIPVWKGQQGGQLGCKCCSLMQVG